MAFQSFKYVSVLVLNCTVSVHLDWQLILYIGNVQLYILILYFVLFKVHWCKKYSGSRIVACNPACCSRARIWATGYISGHQGAPSRGHQGAPSGHLPWGTKLAPTNHSSKTNPDCSSKLFPPISELRNTNTTQN